MRDKYGLKDNRDWQLAISRNDLRANNEWQKAIIECAYRPFDNRYCYFSYAAMDYPRRELLDHVAWRENICLLVSRQQNKIGFSHVFLSDKVPKSCVTSNKTREQNYAFPLYIYDELLGGTPSKQANFNSKIFKSIQKSVSDIQPQSLFDFIYAVLHSRAYRHRYAEFLKSDFPRIPHPKDAKTFHSLAAKGQSCAPFI